MLQVGVRMRSCLLPSVFAIALAAGLGCTRLLGTGPRTFSGTIEVTEHAVGARAAGRLVTLTVDEGDEVTVGQVLGTLDRFEQAEREHQRNTQLVKSGGVAQEEFEHSKLSLEDQQIVAPVAGTILVKVHETGEVVGANTPVVVIGDRSKMWVRIFIPEGEINRVAIGQAADVRVDGMARAFPARVSAVAPKAAFTPRNVQTKEERVTQTFAVKVTLDAPDPALRPGVAADVTLLPPPTTP